MVTIKVGISGVGGVGKSTLCQVIAAYFRFGGRKVELVEEVAGQVTEELASSMGDLDQKKVAVEIVAHELRATIQSPDLIVCDRTIMDAWVYTMYQHKMGRVTDETRGFVEKVYHMWGDSYDLMFYIKRPNDVVMDTRKKHERLEESALLDVMFQDVLDYAIGIAFKTDLFDMAQEIVRGIDMYVKRCAVWEI